MEYYSGTSRNMYDWYMTCTEKNPKFIGEINCQDPSNQGCLQLAFGFAIKRAKQDMGEPIVIQITKPEEFDQIGKCYPILKGRLNKKNHVILLEDEVRKLLKF